jgi:hypothetical protein
MFLQPTEKSYPQFVDSAHDRPILTYSGENRALAILTSLIGGLVGFAWLLTYLN